MTGDAFPTDDGRIANLCCGHLTCQNEVAKVVAAQREADAAEIERLREDRDMFQEKAHRFIAGFNSVNDKLGAMTERAEGAEAQLAAVAAVLDEVAKWTPMNSHDAGFVYAENSVDDLVEDLRAALSSAPVAHDEAVEGASLSDLLGNTRVMFWQCPIPEHAMRSGVVTVEWKGDVAHCTFPGCLRKSRSEAVE